ncbi:MAG: hypothetical protein FWF57_02130 [Defluviitaleaceae bacterium]|nr:hypothetical protein [Defluviitaleaceae bacterium]
MTAITRDKITLKCHYPIWDFYDIEINHKVNEHTKLKVEALLKWTNLEQLSKVIYTVKEEDEIQVTIQNNEGDTEILFTGVPVKVDVQTKRHEGILILECYSATYNMDMRESSRSFQDTSMEYSDMFKFVMNHYPNGSSKNTGAKGKTINRPVIQYKETDWQFLKRMASEVGTVLTPDITSKDPKLWLGIPEKNKSINIGAEKPLRRLNAATLEQEKHFYYETTIPNEHIKIGDEVNVLGDKVIVTEATFKYKKDDNVLRNLYRLELPPKRKWYGNERVRGISIEGKVIDVKLDHVKLHLYIDPEQAKEKAFWYPCKAEANNVWYVMPHLDERVNLHITDIKENSLCMTETRGTKKQMGTPRSLSKPTEKYMLTKWDKQLALHEEDIEWDIQPINILMTEESVFIESTNKITIETDTELNIGKTEFVYFENGEKKVRIEETKNITFEAEELVTFQVSSTESVIELDEYNKIHSLKEVKKYGGHSVPSPIVDKR